MVKAIILLSGGLDSTTMLAMAIDQGRKCHAISFDYGQKHKIELESAKLIAAHYQISHHIIKIDPATFDKTSLVSNTISVPKYDSANQAAQTGITSTYVPARNTLFLTYAMGQAEIIDAQEIYIGPNAMDYHPYPDCRPEFIAAFQAMANLATKQAIEGHPPKIIAPLIQWNKADIIKKGKELNAPLHLTFTCYDPLPSGKSCNACLACIVREEGFRQASM